MTLNSSVGVRRHRATSMTAAAAYRLDVEKRKSAPGPDEGSWIVIATIVGQIGYASGSERRRFLDDAATMAKALFDPTALAYGCGFDPSNVNRNSSIAVLRLLAERIEYAGLLNLASSLLEGLASVLPVDSVNAGRVLAQRARVTWKQGKMDLAMVRYQHLRRKATKLRSTELQLRSWGGFAALAQQRGNYPEIERWASLMVKRADHVRYRRLAGLGYQFLMVRAGVARNFDDSIAFGWTAFRHIEGNRRIELEILTNMGQAFLEAGQPRSALNAFAVVLTGCPTVEVAAVALSGHALASAALSDVRGVLWASAEAIALSESLEHRYESASSLLECAAALDAVGDAPYASVLRARASTIAQYAGYFELIYKANADTVAAVKRVGTELRAPAMDVARRIADLRPVGMPDRLVLAGA